MAFTDILKGTRPDGVSYRIRKIDNMYFYSIQLYSQYEGWHWDTQYRDYSYDKVLQRVAKDNYAVRCKVQREEKWEE